MDVGGCVSSCIYCICIHTIDSDSNSCIHAKYRNGEFTEDTIHTHVYQEFFLESEDMQFLHSQFLPPFDALYTYSLAFQLSAIFPYPQANP